MSVQAVATVVLLGVAGALGAVARYLVVEWVAPRWAHRFPLATFLINISGAFALGLIVTTGGRGGHVQTARLLLGTGFLGGYTTFSTLSFETDTLARHGHTFHAWANAAGTLVVGIAAASIGAWIGSSL